MNYSRAPMQQELLTKITLNNLFNWQFLTERHQRNGAIRLLSEVHQRPSTLDQLSAGSKQLITYESFTNFNTRIGLTNNDGL